MKNIHVQSTDKKTILHFDHTGLFLTQNYQLSNTINSIVQGRNIYITSDTADINDNDYIITKDSRLVQVSYLLSSDLDGASKVILTTDQDLINDGVQSIPYDFLEWFCENSSCEMVEVIKEYKDGYGNWYNYQDDFKFTDLLIRYKIITPKDEVFEMYKDLYGKPVKMNDRFETEHIWNEELALKNKGRWIPKEEPKKYKTIIVGNGLPKQETLEEACERLTQDYNGNLSEKLIAKTFITVGVKWIQEQNKNKYSKEEVLNLLQDFANEDFSNVINIEEWFEKFKKK